MIRVLSTLFFCLFMFLGYAQSVKKAPLHNVYDETDYVLLKVDSLHGNVAEKYYVNKYDSARKMRLYYFSNGKLLAKGFSYHDKTDGKLKIYSAYGKLIQIDTFKNGVRLYSRLFYKPATKLYSNGKSYPFTTIDSLKQ